MNLTFDLPKSTVEIIKKKKKLDQIFLAIIKGIIDQFKLETVIFDGSNLILKVKKN
jgi:hypothetical protein